jgi:hypothetical protein
VSTRNAWRTSNFTKWCETENRTTMENFTRPKQEVWLDIKQLVNYHFLNWTRRLANCSVLLTGGNLISTGAIKSKSIFMFEISLESSDQWIMKFTAKLFTNPTNFLKICILTCATNFTCTTQIMQLRIDCNSEWKFVSRRICESGSLYTREC